MSKCSDCGAELEAFAGKLVTCWKCGLTAPIMRDSVNLRSPSSSLAVDEKFSKAIRGHLDERMAYIERHRETLLEAWIAQHGFAPDETMLITETRPDTSVECTYVRRRGDAAELAWFRKREPLLTKLLETLAAGELYDPEGGGDFCPEDVTRDARAVREFKIGGDR